MTKIPHKILFASLLVAVCSANSALAQESEWNDWNDFGDFDQFQSTNETDLEPEAEELEQPKIDLPVPKPEEIIKQEKAKQIEVKEPPKVPEVQVPAAPVPVKEDVPSKSEKTDTKPQKAKPVVLKEKSENKEQKIIRNRRMVEEDIRSNTKIADLLGADEEIEDLYEKNPQTFSRRKYNHKVQPNSFFVDNQNESNSHLPKIIYQKEYVKLIFAAVDQDNVGALKSFIDLGVDVNARISTSGTSLVMYAVKNGKLKALNYLIVRGANLNTPDNNGKTPLHIAVAEGKMPIFKMLIAAGANPFIKDKKGKFPTDYSIPSLRPAFDTVIAAHVEDKNMALINFSASGSIAAVKQLLNDGAEINYVDNAGNTALMKAAENKHLDIVSLLLANGADPLIKNMKNENSLHFAKVGGSAAIYNVIDSHIIKMELDSGEGFHKYAFQNKLLSQQSKVADKETTVKVLGEVKNHGAEAVQVNDKHNTNNQPEQVTAFSLVEESEIDEDVSPFDRFVNSLKETFSSFKVEPKEPHVQVEKAVECQAKTLASPVVKMEKVAPSVNGAKPNVLQDSSGRVYKDLSAAVKKEGKVGKVINLLPN